MSTFPITLSARWQSVASRVMLPWVVAGLAAWTFGRNLAFRPADWLLYSLYGLSVSIGMGLLFAFFCGRQARENLKKLGRLRATFVVTFCAFLFPTLGFGLLYVLTFTAHMIAASPALGQLTIRSKGSDLPLPGRCDHYVRFKELEFFFLSKACVSAEEFHRLSNDDVVPTSSSVSVFGVRHHSVGGSDGN